MGGGGSRPPRGGQLGPSWPTPCEELARCALLLCRVHVGNLIVSDVEKCAPQLKGAVPSTRKITKFFKRAKCAAQLVRRAQERRAKRKALPFRKLRIVRDTRFCSIQDAQARLLHNRDLLLKTCYDADKGEKTPAFQKTLTNAAVVQKADRALTILMDDE